MAPSCLEAASELVVESGVKSRQKRFINQLVSPVSICSGNVGSCRTLCKRSLSKLANQKAFHRCFTGWRIQAERGRPYSPPHKRPIDATAHTPHATEGKAVLDEGETSGAAVGESGAAVGETPAVVGAAVGVSVGAVGTGAGVGFGPVVREWVRVSVSGCLVGERTRFV